MRVLFLIFIAPSTKAAKISRQSSQPEWIQGLVLKQARLVTSACGPDCSPLVESGRPAYCGREFRLNEVV
jgi:hypothetical protein